MRVINYVENSVVRKKRSSVWMVEAGLIIGVAIGLAGLAWVGTAWLHRPHHAAPIVATAPGQTAADPDTLDAQSRPTGSPLLWVMTKGDATLYLFGSFNSAGDMASGWMDRRLFAAFDNADTAVFEMGAYPKILPGDKVTPHSDALLFQRAVTLHKTTLSLAEGKAEAGRITAEGVTDDGFVLPVEAWRTGDQKALTDSLSLMAQADPAGYQALVVRRNRAWLPAIEQALRRKGTSFVTVGATHLIGPDGLVASLRQAGYTVTRLDG
jgi:uncharacterized protein YbaP (TraB family)